jgi:cysteinyl-tRNA synthetase
VTSQARGDQTDLSHTGETHDSAGHPIALQELRAQKLWSLSDKIRDRLTEMGVVIEDTRDGSTWRWK